MMKPPLLNPNPGPQPLTPPGIPPAPPLPQAGSPGGTPPGAAAPGAPAAAGPGPSQGAPDPSQGGGNPAAAPETPESAPPGEVRPRLIPGSDATSGDVPASPEEQDDLQQTLVKAGNMIHGRTSRNQVLQSLHDPSGTVAQAVGRTAAQILMTIDGQRQAVGSGPIDHDVLKEAARHVIPELMDVGISAGLFPLKPTPGTSPDGEVGVGTDPYNKEIRMAMLEATKVYGEQQLKRPDAKQLSQAAGDEWANGVRQEVSNGTADPRYLAIARPQAAGRPALIPDQQPAGAPSDGA